MRDISRWEDILSDWRWYRAHAMIVKATQIPTPFTIETPKGIANGEAMDYIIEGARGMRFHMSRKDFEKLYEPMDPDRVI